MSKFQDVLNTYDQEFKKLGVKYDPKLLVAVTKICGPSIYKKDDSKVAAGRKDEIERVKKNFLIKKLGLEDSDKLDEGIQAVVEILGKGNRNKYRAMFYYLLVKQFRKANLFRVYTKDTNSINSETQNASISQYYNKIVLEDANLLKRLAK